MIQYRADIDGLRAVAVLAVVFHHAGLGGFSGGFVGVDVFFVITGYLITNILHEEMRQGRFSLLSFYERRARRLLPALFLVLAASLIAGWIWLSPVDFEALARSAAASLAFLSNVWFWHNSGGYFDAANDSLPLLHTWTLALEEQFYIIFPLFLLVLVRRGQPVMLGCTLALVAASLMLSAWATPRLPQASFYLLPTRLWELGFGAVLALGFAPQTGPRWVRESAGFAGLAAIILAVALYNGETVFPGLAALAPVLGAAALIWAGGAGGSLIGRLLSWKPFVMVGLVSYSLYLWHWPVMAFARNRLMVSELQPTWQVGTIALSFLLAFATWRFIERPFRAGGALQFSRLTVFGTSALAASLLGGAIAFVLATDGAEQRFTKGEAELLNSLIHPEFEGPCHGARSPAEFCRFGDVEGQGGSWLLWGDSHAAALLPAIDAVSREHDTVLDLASEPACAPLPGLVRSDRDPNETERCLDFTEAVERYIIDSREYDTVILHARWPLYVEGSRKLSDEGAPIILAHAEASQFAGDAAANPALVEAALQGLVERLEAAGTEVVILGPVPEMPWHVGERLEGLLLYGAPVPAPLPVARVDEREARTRPMLARVAERSGALLVPLTNGMCTKTCPAHDGQTPLYLSESHLSSKGALRLALPTIAHSFQALRKPDQAIGGARDRN